MSERDETSEGPVEAGPWPQRLPASVVSPAAPHRVHGFALCDDLATNYDFGEYVLTALTGSPPDRAWGTAVNTALTALGAITVADAPVHAATLSRRCGAHPRSALATGLIGLCEHAAHTLDHPAAADGTATATQVAAVFERLPPSVRETIGETPSTVEALALAVLHGAGLRSRTQQVAAICIAKLPALAAELEATEPGDLKGYPMRLPEFRYEEGDGDG